jgi:hypothetical protein
MANSGPRGHMHSVDDPDVCFCDAGGMDPDDVLLEDNGEAMQRAEMRAETFAAEAALGMRAGTTEGWYDEPEDSYDPMDPSTW